MEALYLGATTFWPAEAAIKLQAGAMDLRSVYSVEGFECSSDS